MAGAGPDKWSLGPAVTVLILGGTAEARALAAELVADGIAVVSSLAGRVSRPALPAGGVRVGGFGGAAGLVHYLREHRIAAIVDATHPFAAQISANAAAAAEQTRTPLVRLERASWREHANAGEWTWVPDVAAAREAAESLPRPFVTTGRQSLEVYLPWADREVLVRVVDPPEFTLPDRWTLIRSRGPYTEADERVLMLDWRVGALLTKDSGGEDTAAKLQVAAALGLPVVVVERPPQPAGVHTVRTVAAARARLRQPDA